MTRRKTHEEMAFTRSKNRMKRMRSLLEQIAYDFYDSEFHGLYDLAEEYSNDLLEFETAFAKRYADFQQHARERGL